MHTDKEIKEIFFELEGNKALYEYTFSGFSLYMILRFKIECHFRLNTGITTTSVNTELKSKLRNSLSAIKSIPGKLYRNRNLQKYIHSTYDSIDKIEKSSLLFLSTSGITTNVSTSIELLELIKYYYKIGHKTPFVQPTYNSNIKKQPFYTSFLPINTEKKAKITGTEKKVLKKFLEYLSHRLTLDFSSQLESFQNYLSYIKSYYLQLCFLIEKTDCQYIFARSIYTEPWILMACSLKKKQCIEVQHGVITPDNIYFQSSLPLDSLTSKSLLMPDYILTLGHEWRNIIINQHYAFSEKNTFTLGTTDIAEKQEKKETENGFFNVLMASQPGLYNIKNLIAEFLNLYADRLLQEKIHIHLRPHPNETLKDYDVIWQKNRNVITIQNPKEILLKDALIKTDALFSATSMCIYEAIANGIAVISLSSFKGSVIPSNITFVEDSTGLYNAIMQLKTQSNPPKKLEYLSKFNTDILNHFIN